MAVFYPNLVELISIGNVESFDCVWHTKDRETHQLRKCRNPSASPDRVKRETLLQKLRELVSYNSAATTLDSNSTDYRNEPEVLSILRTVSELVLCKGSHRGSKSGILYDKWIESPGDLESHIDRDKISATRKKLGINPDEDLACCGNTRGISCQNWIESTKRERARTMIKRLADAPTATAPADSTLKKLASLLLCFEHHHQVDSEAEKWSNAFVTLTNNQREKRQPTSKTVVNTTNSTSPSCRRNDSTVVDPGTVIGPSPHLTRSRTRASDPPQQDRQCLSQGRPTRKTAQAERIRPPETAAVFFEPFNKTLFKEVTVLLRRDLLPSEYSYGSIYEFQRDSCDYVKIGYSKNVEQRRRDWATKCNQIVQILFTEQMPYVAKMEKLIHLLLHKERRREILCNAGRGCAKKHKEWFDASAGHAQSIIEVVKSFADDMPYDKNGQLKPDWRRHIEDCEVKFLADPWQDIIQLLFLRKAVEVKVEEGCGNCPSSSASVTESPDHITDSKSGIKQATNDRASSGARGPLDMGPRLPRRSSRLIPNRAVEARC